MLAALLIWPQYTAPFMWVSLFFIFDTANYWLGYPSLIAFTREGDWKPVVSLWVASLICGFFWEFWNFYSDPKWLYKIPLVEFWYIFEMNKDAELAIRIPDSEKPRVVIIGGGFAGINLAKTINTKHIQVVMVDRNNYHTFQPLLYQVATAGLEPDSIAGPLRKILESDNEFYFRMAQVTGIDPDNHLVKTSFRWLPLFLYPNT